MGGWVENPILMKIQSLDGNWAFDFDLELVIFYWISKAPALISSNNDIRFDNFVYEIERKSKLIPSQLVFKDFSFLGQNTDITTADITPFTTDTSLNGKYNQNILPMSVLAPDSTWLIFP